MTEFTRTKLKKISKYPFLSLHLFLFSLTHPCARIDIYIHLFFSPINIFNFFISPCIYVYSCIVTTFMHQMYITFFVSLFFLQCVREVFLFYRMLLLDTPYRNPSSVPSTFCFASQIAILTLPPSRWVIS